MRWVIGVGIFEFIISRYNTKETFRFTFYYKDIDKNVYKNTKREEVWKS